MAGPGFPPFPPNKSRYSPSRAYGDEYGGPPPVAIPPFPPMPPYPPRPFDVYGSEPPRPSYGYEQPRGGYEGDRYDPYQPSSNGAYDPGVPQLRQPPPPFPPPPKSLPPPPMNFASTMPPRPPPMRSAPPVKTDSAPDHVHEYTLLTEIRTVDVGGYTTAIYSLPPSHLPLEKLVAINPDDALNLHRHICSTTKSVWYADGSSRAGEGWSAAVEWKNDSSRSDKKMRGCVGDADALDAEIGGLCKAVEGFEELLQLSIKDGKPMSHELVVFSDSQAAIVSIDTSSRSEALRFEQMWRNICSQYLQATMKLVWIPRGSDIEGHVLADKIAVVGASNAYLKKRKEGTLSDIYRRPGGGEPEPPGSSVAGAWQRGDADLSRRKVFFERPVPALVSASPPPDASNAENDYGRSMEAEAAQNDADDDAQQPKDGAIFVTHFPSEVTAKDLGVLFAKYGNIVAVDIYHISSAHPRFAFVAYTDPASGLAAIKELHRQAIPLEDDFARQHLDDLRVWRDWTGHLTVVPAEPPRLVPQSVMADFPPLPEWAQRSAKDTKSGSGPPTTVKQEHNTAGDHEELERRKRDRDTQGSHLARSSPPSEIDSPSPHKRLRQDILVEPAVSRSNDPKFTASIGLPTDPQSDASPDKLSVNHSSHNHTLMPPFPPTMNPDFTTNGHLSEVSTSHQANAVRLPPTPQTAEKHPLFHEDGNSPARSLSMDPSGQSLSSKRPLTNSAAEPQEHPIKIGAKTLQALTALVTSSFGKVDVNNWIAHACFIAADLDHARRSLKEDLYATDQAFLTGRDLEQTLSARGFTPARVDAFITKVLKVLDGIALAEQDESQESQDIKPRAECERDLEHALSKYPTETKDAVESAAKLMEYLIRGKEAQEKKRLDVERRVKVLEGMVKIGEIVGGVVRHLLNETTG
ncbi:hypothetical protein BD324DRAFT_433403 [Kockovaella imperatae]|uniref:RRM domain-containing protein n=1 Tax=Kockovaella imperatae TaxID=4999 RepID=A0A1Y1UGR5_9TREE|nr:hypothetical protein BD324DRAFT_433403 [Kockovaella imperatae]ORX37212.1 hypothetical protein BD324DRAFT_433403 [Kockovaella imperatae]